MLIFGWTIPLNFVHVCLCCLFWNNNPYAGQFQGIFHHLMIWCNVSPSTSGNVAAQDETMSLSAVEMSSALEAEETANHPSPFVNISAIVCDHSYLAACFGSLVDNALVYISGFVFDKQAVLWCVPCLLGDRGCTCIIWSELPLAYTEKQWRTHDSFWRYREGGQISWVVYLPVVIIGESCQSLLDQSVCPSWDWFRGCVFSRGAHSGTQFGIETIIFCSCVISCVCHPQTKNGPHWNTKWNTLKLQLNKKSCAKQFCSMGFSSHPLFCKRMFYGCNCKCFTGAIEDDLIIIFVIVWSIQWGK